MIATILYGIVKGFTWIMWKLKLAICDDEEFFRNDLKQLLTTYANEMGYDIELDTWEDAVSLTDALKTSKLSYDMIFFDIEMPGLSGLDAAASLRQLGTESTICFVTSHTEFAFQAYNIDALGYIQKPINYVELKQLMKKAEVFIRYRHDKEDARKRYLNIISARSTITIDLTRVVYIEKRRNQCIFHCTDGEQMCYDSLRNIYKRLNPDIFLYIHQGFIANFSHIKEIFPDHVCFGSGMEAPLSRKYYPAIKARYSEKLSKLLLV